MRSQRGAALIVVLSLLVVSLMLGFSSVKSALIDERLAGNYKAAAQAQMNAERAASDMWHEFSNYSNSPASVSDDNFNPERGPAWSEFKALDEGACLIEEESADVPGSYDGVACYLEISGFAGMDDGPYIVAMGAVNDGSVAVSEPVFVKLWGRVFGFEPESTVTCLGTECSFIPGSGKSGPVIDGTDREVDGKTQGANRPDPAYDENGNINYVPAVLMADMGASIFDSDGDKGKSKGKDKGRGGGVEGEEIYSLEHYNEFKENSLGQGDFDEDEDGWLATKAVMLKEIGAIVKSADDYSNVIYAGPGEEVSPGSAKGIVVVNGGVLHLGGSDKFSGLVIMKGGRIESSGTPAIVGAILGENYSFTGNGNPTVLYSSEAIREVNNRGGNAGSGFSSKPRISGWR